MPRGVVKWFNQRKGFGFVTDGSGQDFFVHFTNVNPETRELLTEGKEVIFEITPGEKGPMAVQVDVAKDD